MPLFIGFDVGTSGTKAALVDGDGRVLATHVAGYALDHGRAGFVEQDPEALFAACAEGARAVVRAAGVAKGDVDAIAFAGQMLALTALDARGHATRPLVSWMDARAEAEARALIRRFGGERALHLLAGASPTAKDLVCKIAWLRRHEPEVYARTVAFSDATGYLVARTTGALALDHTAAGATGMLDVRTRTWTRWLARLAAFPLDKMPRLVPSTEVVGTLRADAAEALDLPTRTRVVMGLADIPAAAIGSGAVRDGDAHVYLGTSAWIGVTARAPISIPPAGIASVPSGDARYALAIGESETAGACRAWLERLLGEGHDLEALAASAPDGARNLLFVPWMYGERSPVPDAHVRGGFVHLSLEHGPADMIRALYEGVAYNLLWTLSELEKVKHECQVLRAIGGGARSDVWLQTLADVTGRTIERVEHAQLAGAIGAALVASVGAGQRRTIEQARDAVRVETTFRPRMSARTIHETRYLAFREFAPSLTRLATRMGARG